MTKVLITGGTGLVGRKLVKKLLKKGYEVAILSRSKNIDLHVPSYHCDYTTNQIDKEAINTADFIIHLAGANISEKRWSTKRKQEILDSRVKTGELILNSIDQEQKKLKAFISASATGYYGSVTSDKIFIEDDPNYNDFIGNTCKSWEQVADEFQSAGVRTVKLRTGIVLTKEDGALAKMTTPLKFRIGALLGNGNQYLSWIHVDDLCSIYIKAIEDIKMKGSYNAVSPQHISYKELIEQLHFFFQKPFFYIKIPPVVLKIIFGEMADILLNGSRVSSQKLIKEGYKFKFPTIQSALTDLIPNKKNS